jgi:tetratricopeptide (TPR) repeat protein
VFLKKNCSLKFVFIMCLIANICYAQDNTTTSIDTETQQQMQIKQGFLEIVGLIHNKQYDEARLKAQAFEPDNPNYSVRLLFVEGLIAKKEQDYDKAIDIFEEILKHNPNFDMVRMELADTYLLNKNYDSAANHARKLQQSSSEEVQDLTSAFLRAIDNKKPFYFSGYFGLAPSTNYNAGPSDNTVTIRGLQFNLEREKKSGIGVVAGVDVGYRIDIADDYAIQTMASYDMREYFEGNFGSHVVATTVMPTFQNNKVLIGAGFTAGHIWFDQKGLNWQVGPDFLFRTKLSDKLSLSVRASSYFQDYYDYDYYDGWLTRVDFRPSYKISRSARIDLITGIDIKNADAEIHSYHSPQFGIAYYQQWKKGFISYLQVRYAPSYYEKEFPVFRKKREDEEFRLSASIGNKELSYLGFYPIVEYQYVNNDSNIPIFTFDRHDVTIKVVKDF